MLTPVIALVGRPNVGKSTLFNRLTRSQNALVGDMPGLTRDRQYGNVTHANKSFVVVDTGGVGVLDQAIDSLMSVQSGMALTEATRIFFVVDAREGLTALDQQIAARLRKLGKPLDLIVNKMDGLEHHTGLIDFQSLGFDSVHGVSATHGHGVQALLDGVTAPFPANDVSLTSEDVSTTTIAFVGRPNVGKSTLINRILGEDRVVVYDMPGTTRDSIFVPFVRDKTSYVLVDTAGVRRRSRVGETMEKFSIIKTLQSIKAAQVCLMVIDAKEGLTDQDLHLLGYIIETGKALVIAVNKWDGLDEDHKEHVKSELDRKLKFAHFATINFISALHGSGVGLLFKAIDAAYRSAMQTFSTPSITRILQDLVMQHAPPTVNGRRIKLRYAHVGGHNPPVIIVHGNQLEMLPESYKRYLMKGFLEQLKLVGTPLKIQFKQGANPYKNKKNALNARQLKKKNRLMRWVKKK